MRFFYGAMLKVSLMPAGIRNSVRQMKAIKIMLRFVCLLLLTSCGFAERKIYINVDGSASVYLSRYATLIPALGPCDFSRDEDLYVISTPKTQGRIDAAQLRIRQFTQDATSCQYAGFIEFLGGGLLEVELYKITKGKKIKLSINGKNQLKVEVNQSGSKPVSQFLCAPVYLTCLVG